MSEKMKFPPAPESIQRLQQKASEAVSQHEANPIRYEYKQILIDRTDHHQHALEFEANEQAKDGWRLVAIVPTSIDQLIDLMFERVKRD